MINFIKNNKQIIKHFIPIYSGIIFYFLINLCNIFIFKINLLSSIYILPDVLFSIFLSYILFLFSKKTNIFLILQFLSLLIIHLSNSIKTSFFGAPIIFDDISLLKEAILSIIMISPIYIIIISLFFIILIVLFIFNFKFRKSGLILLLILFVFIISLYVFPKTYNNIINKIDKNYLFWNQQENYKHNGPIAYFLNQYIRSNHSNQKPKKEEVENALYDLNKNKITTKLNYNNNQNFPNIHFIIIESLWDPKLLSNINFDKDPFYEKFRELRNKSENDFLLSPTFEGKTANPEFELLCGMPVLSNSVVFQTELKNKIDCLPKVLSEIGYITNVFHPDYANFFNRTNAYKNIGFNNYFSLNDYKLDDLNDGKLSDESFYRQSYDFIKNNQTPQFNYYITLSNHIPYSLNENRPHLINNNINNYWLNNYSNSIYYSTKEAYNFINKIKEEDKDSIIIILGDHLPFLGANKEVYEINKNTDNKYLYSTPIIFINKNNIENLGMINMYDFPKKILNLLNIDYSNSIFNLFNLFNSRPLYVDKIKPEYILNNDIKLEKLLEILEDYKVIYNDLLFGNQYSKQLTK